MEMKSINLTDFISLSEGPTAAHFAGSNNLFSYLGPSLNTWLTALLAQMNVTADPLCNSFVPASATVLGPVFIEENVSIEPGAYIKGPCYIGAGTEIRHTAYIRGQTYIGKNCVVGHATEVKSSVFFDGAKAGHFAYVGDSILGQNVNLGAGTKLANLSLKGTEVFYLDPHTKKKTSSGLRKFGGILGDNVQTGCNSVISPGSLLLPNTAIYPCAHFRGTLSEGVFR